MLSKLQVVKYLNRLVGKVYATLPLRTVLIVPFVLQICGVVGLVSYLSFQNGHQAVKKLATQLENEVCLRIEQHLDNYLTTPKQINQINLDAIELDLLNLSDFQTTGHYFWKQMRVFDVGYINFANTKGEFIGIEHLSNRQFLINEVDEKKGLGKLYIYTTDNQGNRRKLNAVKNYDPRLEAWYADAVKAGKPVWSQIYQWEDKPEILSISSSYPLYSKRNQLVGVIGVDLILSQMSDFLGKLKSSQSGKTFILERSGLIVASSTTEAPYTVINGKAKRLSALDSQDALIRQTTEYLTKEFGSLKSIESKQQLLFTADGARYFLQVKPWKDKLGLDWLIVMVIPEADFMEQINSNTRTTILLCIVALLVATQVGILTARWVIKPILQLNTLAKKIAESKWEETAKIERCDELGELAKSFNSMAKQLQESFAALSTKNADLKVLNEALSSTQSWLNKFLEAMPVGVFIIDGKGNPYYINSVGLQILGQGVLATATAEQLSEVYQIYVAGTDELCPNDRNVLLRALQGESITIDDMEIRRDDKIISIETLGTPIYDESGKIAFAIATFTDITQRKQSGKLLAQYSRTLETQVKKRTRELLLVIEKLQTTHKNLIQSQKTATEGQETAERASRAKTEFLANMSHELRTPLNAILGFTQVMSRDDSLSSENQENLKIINRAGEHLLNLINDILEMSKIEVGRALLNESSFELTRLLDNIQEMLRFRAAGKNLELIFEYAPNIPRYVQTDSSKLRQVLLNLLGNALKFTYSGTVKLKVRCPDGENSSNAHLIFEISDTGPGIAPNEMNLLFEAFGQTETGRNSQQGTGLGLAISRKYVQLMGGDIKVSSTLDVGSIFTFDIQITVASESEIQINENHGQIIALAPSQGEYRILVVDDRPESRLLLRKILIKVGFCVKEAANGSEAIALWQEWLPHLILMDMRMPVMDGYEATKVIKGRESLTNPTVILALTASAFEEERQKILSIGCDDFIRKPFSQEVLLEKLSEYLGLTYIVQEETLNSSALSHETQIFTPEAELNLLLTQMSSEWLLQVHHAAASCSDDLILELLEQIPPDLSQIFRIFRDLANNYQFEKIMELTTTNKK